MIYPIVIYGDEVLRKHCHEIAPDYPGLKQLVEDMFLTLEEAEGVGLAAPQIGKDIRLFIVDCTPWAEDDPSCADYKRAFINPEIYAYSDEKKTYNEGCLSFPGIHADVPRSLSIRMRYMDTDFVEHDEEFTGLKPGSSSTSTTISKGWSSPTASLRCAVSCSRASCSTSPRASIVAATRPADGSGEHPAGRTVFGLQPVTRLHVAVFATRHEKSRTSKGPGFFVCRLLRIRIGMRHRC